MAQVTAQQPQLRNLMNKICFSQLGGGGGGGGGDWRSLLTIYRLLLQSS
jgi:hypothetical protein